MLGFLFFLFATGEEPPSTTFWIVASIVAVLATQLSKLPIVLKRPYVIVDKSGLHYHVDSFFHSRVTHRLYLAYGNIDILSMAIDYVDYVKPDLAWGEIKRFDLRRHKLIYQVRAIDYHRRGNFVCGKFSKQRANEIKKTLETMSTK